MFSPIGFVAAATVIVLLDGAYRGCFVQCFGWVFDSNAPLRDNATVHGFMHDIEASCERVTSSHNRAICRIPIFARVTVVVGILAILWCCSQHCGHSALVRALASVAAMVGLPRWDLVHHAATVNAFFWADFMPCLLGEYAGNSLGKFCHFATHTVF